MGGKRIKFESQCNHLGIFRDIKQKVNIEEKISLGRKTAYALMGAGLHSGDGLTKPLCAYLCLGYICYGRHTIYLSTIFSSIFSAS